MRNVDSSFVEILKSSKCKIILTSRPYPYRGSPQDLPGRSHGCLQAHRLFGEAKAKEMESLEEGQERYPDQNGIVQIAHCLETGEAAPTCSWKLC